MGEFAVAEYAVIDGELHKLCKGVLHREGHFVPVTNYYKGREARREKLRNFCIDCDYARKGSERGVVVTQLWMNWLDEIVNRVGVAEGCRRLGMSDAWYRWMQRTKPRKMHRKTARKIVRTLRELRADNVVRHRDSIRHGSEQRGHRERVPTHPRHFYRGQWD